MGSTAHIDMRDLAELIVRRMADEQIAPLNNRIQALDVRFAKVETAVIGNGVPSLSKQIESLGEKCEAEHQRLHDRISAKGSSEGRKNSQLRERLVGAGYALSAAGSLVVGAIELYQYLKGGH